MRRAERAPRVPFAVLAGCLGAGVLPAFAADATVSDRDELSPTRVAVKPGET